MENSVYSSALYVDVNILHMNMHSLERRWGRFIPVLKANAYGLGLLPVASVAEKCAGVEMLAVAQVLEGERLRHGGIQKEILVLGGSLPRQWPAAAKLNLTLTVTRPGMVAELERLAQPIQVQLKIETGLNRNGVLPGAELAQVIEELKAARFVHLTGTYSHFAAAEERDVYRCRMQQMEFDRALAQLRAAGVEPGLCHLCNSAAGEWMPQARYDCVRVGRGLYMDAQDAPLGDIREVASWRAGIVGVRQLPAGARLGYGSGVQLEKNTRVAIVNVGYGDGLNRQVADGGPVFIRGQRARLLGCCMDQCFVDVGCIPCEVGDEVTLFGTDGQGNRLPAQEVARLCGDEGCGLTAALGDRVERIYL